MKRKYFERPKGRDNPATRVTRARAREGADGYYSGWRNINMDKLSGGQMISHGRKKTPGNATKTGEGQMSTKS